MSPPVVSAPATWDDFIALEEDDLRELIDGELVEVEVPTALHEYVVARLVTALTVWMDRAAEAGHGGRVLASGYKVRISERRGVMPDLQLFRHGNVPARDQDLGLARGRPDLAVEIVSPSSRRYDRVTKLRWYAQIGVPEYWIVDPGARTLERMVLRDGGYWIVDSLADEDVLRPSSFAGLELPLAKLWG